MIRNNKFKTAKASIKNGYVLILSDIHFPYQDDKAIDYTLDTIKMLQPKVIILNGDIIDFYKLSRFSKDPRGRSPEEEINMCREFLQRLRNVASESEIYYNIGNHETRLERYIMDNAPEISGIVGDVFDILNLSDYNVQGVVRVLINDDFIVEHGKRLGAKSGLSAIKELEAHYTSGATGHTHRLARFSTLKCGKRFVWFETGCLCDLTPSYINDPDWEQGFVILEYQNFKLTDSKIVPI